MRLIAVDIGNSASKLGLDFDHQFQPQQTFRWFGELSENQDVIEQLAMLLGTDGAVSTQRDLQTSASYTWAVCSVHQPRLEALRQWVLQQRPQDQFIPIATAHAPLEIEVDFPNQVGHDRLMAAVAASRLRQRDDQAMIVIDAGTAVTIDLLLPNDRFVGGNIFLGADAEFENISSRTDALPRLDYTFRQQRLSQILGGTADANETPLVPFGKNTVDAILSGVYQSQMGAIHHLVSIVAQTIQGPCRVVGTGGGIAELLRLVESLDVAFWKEDWVFDAQLVLAGIAITIQSLTQTNGDGGLAGQSSEVGS